jgi:hypothetical protein
MGAMAGAHLAPAAGTLVKKSVLWDAKTPVGYERATDRLHRKDAGAYP